MESYTQLIPLNNYVNNCVIKLHIKLQEPIKGEPRINTNNMMMKTRKKNTKLNMNNKNNENQGKEC
jgi:hypothetical protein